MKFGYTRLTLFALISSIEEDLRNIITSNLPDKPLEIIHEEQFEKFFKRFNKENSTPKESIKTEELLYYADFKENIEILNRNDNKLPEYIKNVIKSHNGDFEKLTPIRNRVAHSRPLSYNDFSIVQDVTSSLLCSSSNDLWTNLSNSYSRLKKEPSFVLGLNIPESFLREENIYNNLPLPEFDDTGYIGRKKLVQHVKQLCLGAYPVISIVGDGGQGKSALALKVAYELLESRDNPFEAIIWSTSKTMQLTNNEIQKIDDCITDSMGVFKNIESNVLNCGTDNPIETVLEYLRNFKILLIIDNLETVLDDRIRQFLGSLPNGSKVLITSRIGLGAFEYPVKLQPMESSDSINLLRCLATLRDQTFILKTHNSKLVSYCNKMNNNPGYIKWFISAMQSGKRPEEILDKPHVFLDFCMSNVYEYLDDESRSILRSLLCINGELSNAELAYINEIGFNDLQKGLHQLMTTNMVQMRSTPKGSSFESKYDISDFARQYLLKNHPTKSSEFKKFRTNHNKLISRNEKFRNNNNLPKYSIYNIDIRSESDTVIAHTLIDALNASKVGKYQKANELIESARNLAPEFYEVRRCEAWIKSMQGNVSLADEAYQAAIELEPNNARLYFWYAGFILRYLHDTYEAKRILTKAYSIDRQTVDISIELARINMYLGEYDETDRILFELQDLDLSDKNMKITYDLKIQNNYRLGEYFRDNDNIEKAISSYERMINTYKEVPDLLVDDTMKRSIYKAEYSLNKCFSEVEKNPILSVTNLKDRILKLINMRLDILEIKNSEPIIVCNDPDKYGTIVKLFKSYGFILSEEGFSHFFHRTALLNKYSWYRLKIGMKVGFSITTDRQGRTEAIQVIEI